MRVLAITKVFPNAAAPLDAPHIRQQYAALADRCDLSVLATIPWFPGVRWLRGRSAAARVADAPRMETIDGLSVLHPRFFFLPRMALSLQSPLYAASLLPAVLPLRGEVDLVFATWAHPDGVAAVALARLLGVPAVVEVIGSDINVTAKRWGARWPLRAALPHAARVVAVSRQLADSVVRLGVPRSAIDVIPTGVNTEIFQPRPRADARAALVARGESLPRGERLVLFVGRLEKEKGIFDLVRAFQGIGEDVGLVFLGDGSRREELQNATRHLGPRVQVLGGRPLEDVPEWLGACDLLALPSWAEGTPNVILEALAAGRRVVASRVGGIPDVVRSRELGWLAPPRDVTALRTALGEAVRADYDPACVRRAAPVFAWSENARRLHECFEKALCPESVVCMPHDATRLRQRQSPGP